MCSATSSGYSELVRTVDPFAKAWLSWRCIINNESATLQKVNGHFDSVWLPQFHANPITFIVK